MAVVTAGLYKVTLEQLYLGNIILNTFWYLNSLGSDDEQDKCAEAFDLDILPDLADTQHEDLSYAAIRVRNVTGTLADHILTPTTTQGARTGAVANTFTAFGIRLNRTTKETRNGQKRFAGLTEEIMEGQTLAALFITTIAPLAAALVADISTVGGIFEAVIAAEDPITPGNWFANPVLSSTVNPFITSQVSRKQGHGN